MRRIHPAERLRPLTILLAALLVVVVLLVGRLVPVTAWITSLVVTIRGAGAAGVALFYLAYVAVGVLMLPGALMAMMAGFVYGPIAGLIVAWPASVLAGTCAFVLGRTVLRQRVQRMTRGWRRTQAFDRAVSREGLKLVILLRASPLAPFTVLNYAFGLSRISLRDFFVGSLIGEVPGVWLNVYVGSLVTTLAQLSMHQRRFTTPQLLIYAAGMVATAVAAFVIGRIATQALRRSDIDPALDD
ncbi:MAG: TVP38/TMEM64 family protein [Bacteroidales bacterium]